MVTSQTWQAAQDSFEGPCLRYLRFMATSPHCNIFMAALPSPIVKFIQKVVSVYGGYNLLCLSLGGQLSILMPTTYVRTSWWDS